MYNKIFTKILDSSIWMEPLPTRIVWLTFIAAMDEQGFVAFASPANVAHRAIVPLDDTIKALETLEGPDINSSDPDNGGRRLEKVPGGWIVLNAEKYRLLVTRAVAQERTRDRVRRHRAKNKVCNGDVTVANDSVTQSEAGAETVSDTEEEGENNNPLPSASPISGPTPSEDKKRKRREDVLALMRKYSVKLELGSDHLFIEWIEETNGYPLSVIESALKDARPRIRLPSQLRKYLQKLK